MTQFNENAPPLAGDTSLVQSRDVFAEIIAGRLPASVVYRDEMVLAIMDIQPVNAGHVLVIPLKPARFLHELDEATVAHLFVVGKRVAAAIRASGVECEGINILLADGAAAGQEVPHLHLHVLPRFPGDGFGFTFPHRYFTLPDRKELDAIARKVRSAMGKAI